LFQIVEKCVIEKQGRVFFAIGHNIAHSDYLGNLTPIKSILHQTWISQLADNGGNFTRIELGENYLPDWDKYYDYTNQMSGMWEFDRIIETCESKEIYFILFRHHTELKQFWHKNPYNGLVASRYDYFVDRYAIMYQLKALRYILSRWGYSVNLSMYGYSEVDNWLFDMMKDRGITNKTESQYVTNGEWHQAYPIFSTWLNIMKTSMKGNQNSAYFTVNTSFPSNAGQGQIKGTLLANYDKLFMNTHGINEKHYMVLNHVIQLNDVNGPHKYGLDKERNIKGRFAIVVNFAHHWPDKPYIFEEMGYQEDFDLAPYCCTGVDFKKDLWATSFMGGFGTGMSWWWDRTIHLNEYYKEYNFVKAFFTANNVNLYNLYPDTWKDYTISFNSNIKNSVRHNYFLSSLNKEISFGYVDAANIYWRNLQQSNPCIQELVTTNKLQSPCVCEDGILVGDNWNYQTNSINTNFYNPNYTDSYTPGMSDNSGIHASFVVKNLKSTTVWFDRKWYEVTFYDYNPNSGMYVAKQQVLHTNVFGSLDITPPLLTNHKPGYPYKIIYLGAGTNAPSNMPIVNEQYQEIEPVYLTDIAEEGVLSSSEQKTDGLFFTIYPNPASDFVNVQCTKKINLVKVYNSFGSEVIHKFTEPQLEVELNVSELSSGLYIVLLQLEDETWHYSRLIKK
jgi:hypothetical protein